MNYNILIVEDNDYTRKMMVNYLNKNGFSVYEASSGKEAIDIMKRSVIYLITLDLNLGDMEGGQILNSLRKQNIDIPVIVVSTIDKIDRKVKLFESGADDYLTKPFYNEELLVRIKKLLSRRYYNTALPNRLQEEIISPPFKINLLSYQAFKNGALLNMKKKVFNLFLYFVQNANIVLSKDQIYERVWGTAEDFNDNSITVHIHELRSLIEDDPGDPVYIKTIKGVGFIYSAESKN